MTSLSIMFWTMAALIGVLCFTIEAGAASRYRRVVLCSLGSTLVCLLYIMFAIDDSTMFDLKRTEKVKTTGGGGGSTELGAAEGGGADRKDGSPGDEDGGGEGGNGNGGGDDAAKGKSKGKEKGDDALPKLFQDCPVCPKMVKVRKGRFKMGSPDSETGRTTAESPVREIALEPMFAVGRYPITRDQFGKFVAETSYVQTSGCMFRGKPSAKHGWNKVPFEQAATHPVVCVSEKDVNAYLAWLGQRSGKTYRLLTEGEFEYVARAGTSTAYWWGEKLTQSAAADFNIGRTRDGTAPSDLTPVNDFEVSDVHGNVAQHVSDCWGATLHTYPANAIPYSIAGCRRGVVRGGYWSSPVEAGRSAARQVLPDDTVGYDWVGFRVARELNGRTRAFAR